jgi:REP element-mobilizing transposase RayT
MKKKKQTSFIKNNWNFRYKHGGELRKKRKGRFHRPLSTKAPHHVVFKLHKSKLKHSSLRSSQSFLLSQKIIRKYAKKFFVKIEQLSIQHDHIHMCIRTSRRSLFFSFFRVVAGQISQQFKKDGLLKSVTDTKKKKTSLWIHRPFSHLIVGYRAYRNVRNYIQLNEKEVTGTLPYRKERLRGLSQIEWDILWT